MIFTCSALLALHVSTAAAPFATVWETGFNIIVGGPTGREREDECLSEGLQAVVLFPPIIHANGKEGTANQQMFWKTSDEVTTSKKSLKSIFNFLVWMITFRKMQVFRQKWVKRMNANGTDVSHKKQCEQARSHSR